MFDHVAEAATAWFLALILNQSKPQRTWILVSSPKLRERISLELELWKIAAEILPEFSLAEQDGEITDASSAAARLEILERAAGTSPFTVLIAADAFSQAAPDPKKLRQGKLELKCGLNLDLDELVAQLIANGCERSHLVQGRGQFAVRGGIIDVFPWQAPNPLRIEFFDTEIDSLREFDVDTQASIRVLDHASLTLGEPTADATLESYRKAGDLLIGVGDDLIESLHVRITDQPANQAVEEDFSTAAFANPLGRFDAGDFVLEHSRRDQFFDQLAKWRHLGWLVGIVFSNQGERDRFKELLSESNSEVAEADAMAYLYGELIESFVLPGPKIALISSSEIFGRYRDPGTARRSRTDRQRIAATRASLDDISEGDLVVHSEYGVGRFAGIRQGENEEEITIDYRDGGQLAVPIDQAHLVGRYVGIGGKTPQLSKLGGNTWKNVRKSAEKTILDYAAQLLRVQAERQADQGSAHPPDSRWMWEFESSFHFTETTDQKRAILETKQDMEAAKPMDRLICGDVGFGKTEVAIRAAFKAVTSGKQVALLCPTTVLAEQHWRTFRERMSEYPIRVDLLNRFRTGTEVRKTLEGLADGSVDIVIGTHRLISGDVVYKDLGLAVVDEEQRFGVKHKEKFKELFRYVDVLTLSATPIPRTLYMALMGARDMSTIDTPPPNRVPVHTSVVSYDERIIRDAINREIKRGGQVFFLHNRVKSIEMVHRKLSDLVPDARILVGHGQMEKDELEVVMRRFVQGDADVLLATTIIETGIDIPNANTILIDRADRFGLADLYQLRGRVGRAGEKAYAILLLPREFITAGDARKRIHAIKQYTALGSGFKIAMRDLEIRGAGNLLGTKQSGQIAAVGFDLYCQLLRQSVDRLQGKKMSQRADTSFRSDFIAFSELKSRAATKRLKY